MEEQRISSAEYEQEWEQEEQEEEQEDMSPVSRLQTLREKWQWLRAHMPQILIYARYVLPVLTVTTLFVMGLFYNVRLASGGSLYEASLVRLHFNTVSAMEPER